MSQDLRATRVGLRRMWIVSGGAWERVPEAHRPRNLAIARAFVETDEPAASIAARHGLSRERVRAIAQGVIYTTLGVRPPRR
jgi:hypothetical protein